MIRRLTQWIASVLRPSTPTIRTDALGIPGLLEPLREAIGDGMFIDAMESSPPPRGYLSSGLPSDDELTDRAVRMSNLSKCRDRDLEFFRSMRSLGPKGMRNAGTPLTKAQKANLGIKSRAVITVEFAETLNEAGLADPVEAAWTLALTISRSVAARDALADLGPYGEPDSLVRFVPSNMAAGPCDVAASLGGVLFERTKAPMIPLDGCRHILQCGCCYLTDNSALFEDDQ